MMFNEVEDGTSGDVGGFVLLGHILSEIIFQGYINRLIDCLVFYAAFNNISVISQRFLGK